MQVSTIALFLIQKQPIAACLVRMTSVTSSPAYISSARVYCSGNNLLLLSGFKLWDIEMGGSGLGYPIQRVINLGVQINF